MSPVLWLIEGIPGSGKTTTASRLCNQCCQRGMNARWWLEEDRDHPVHPISLRRRASERGFDHLCIDAYRSFVRNERGVLILEGSAFQSTVRLMYAHAASIAEITGYIASWSAHIATAAPRLQCHRIENPYAHYADFVTHERGSSWIKKLIAYVEQTPLAVRRRWSGFSGFVSFWSEYQDLCLALIDTLPMPVRVAPSWAETGKADEEQTFSFFAGRESQSDTPWVVENCLRTNEKACAAPPVSSSCDVVD